VNSDSWRREQRDDFTLSELLNALWGRRLLIGGGALVLSLCSVLFGLSREPAYVAEATVAVRPEAFGDAEEPEALAREAMYAAVTTELPRDAMRRAGWSRSPQEFNERLGVETDHDNGEIHVRFSDTTAEGAARAANVYAEAFVERVDHLSQRGLAGVALESSAQVTRRATAPEGRSSPALLLYGVLGGAAGLFFGGSVTLALESRTRKWRGAKDAELTLRAPVLGVIPDYHLEERPEERVG
jgi:capsular polysaccharide biosynthesis protein